MGAFSNVHGPAARSGASRSAEVRAVFRSGTVLSRPGEACPRHARGRLGDGGRRGRPGVLCGIHGGRCAVSVCDRGGLYPAQDERSAGARPEHAAADVSHPPDDLRSGPACRSRNLAAPGMGAVRSGVDDGLRRGCRHAIPRRSPARDLRRRHRHLRSAGGRDPGLRATGPAARPCDAGSGDRPARTLERREYCGCEQRRCADRQAGRQLRAGAACPDTQHGRVRLRRAGADPAGRPRLDGASAAMAGRRRGPRPPAGDDRQPVGGRRGLRPERAAGDVQCRGRGLDTAAEAARHHRHLLRGVGAANRRAVAGVRCAAREHGRGMGRALPQQGQADHAPGRCRPLVRMVGEGHTVRPHGRPQGRRHRPQEA